MTSEGFPASEPAKEEITRVFMALKMKRFPFLGLKIQKNITQSSLYAYTLPLQFYMTTVELISLKTLISFLGSD